MSWASDTAISMPSPVDTNSPIRVDFLGFGFTSNGIAHNLTEADWEALSTPTIAPVDWNVKVRERG
jgi:hypothetical protein